MINQPTIEYTEANRALDAIYSEVLKRGKAGVIAVCDAHGDLIAFARMDGAPLSSITIAMNKAYSAARERKPTHEIGRAARNPEKGFDIGYFGDPRFTGWGGGYGLCAGVGGRPRPRPTPWSASTSARKSACFRTTQKYGSFCNARFSRELGGVPTGLVGCSICMTMDQTPPAPPC